MQQPNVTECSHKRYEAAHHPNKIESRLNFLRTVSRAKLLHNIKKYITFRFITFTMW